MVEKYQDDPTTPKGVKSTPFHAGALATTADESEHTVSFLKPSGDRVTHVVPADHGLVASFQQMLEQFEADFAGVAAWFEAQKNAIAAKV